ncbi:hypothetical protein BKL49_06810 [Rodentibacter myodis]|uniref:Uncharacterized protein n=1 Tax=Rodentibacter myodis TaxID=1907939 RepID=A0A1V3JPW9_9PAST|nr:hypothetical protein BKL49_06810 [Rodentibacter myodis]
MGISSISLDKQRKKIWWRDETNAQRKNSVNSRDSHAVVLFQITPSLHNGNIIPKIKGKPVDDRFSLMKA